MGGGDWCFALASKSVDYGGRCLLRADPSSPFSSTDTSRRLLTSLKILRRHGCNLPVEVFGFPSELASMGKLRGEIESLGQVTFREVETPPVQGAWKQFQIVRTAPSDSFKDRLLTHWLSLSQKGEAIARSSLCVVSFPLLPHSLRPPLFA